MAIVGPNSVPEHVLARLLEGKGYAVKLLKVPPTGAPTALPEGCTMNDLIDGVDVVLLWPAPLMRNASREAFIRTMSSFPTAAKIPTLALSPVLELALQDELAVDAPLECQFENLVRSIEIILGAEAS